MLAVIDQPAPFERELKQTLGILLKHRGGPGNLLYFLLTISFECGNILVYVQGSDTVVSRAGSWSC